MYPHFPPFGAGNSATRCNTTPDAGGVGFARRPGSLRAAGGGPDGGPAGSASPGFGTLGFTPALLIHSFTFLLAMTTCLPSVQFTTYVEPTSVTLPSNRVPPCVRITSPQAAPAAIIQSAAARSAVRVRFTRLAIFSLLLRSSRRLFGRSFTRGQLRATDALHGSATCCGAFLISYANDDLTLHLSWLAVQVESSDAILCSRPRQGPRHTTIRHFPPCITRIFGLIQSRAAV